MDQKTGNKLEVEGIHQLLSLLHGEFASLETEMSRVLLVLQDLEDQVLRDDLTGLWKRNLFEKKAEALIERARAEGTRVGVLILDIDHFKNNNDTQGHATGDEVLSQFGILLKRFENDRTLIARLGGEEFAVFRVGNDASLVGLAETIRRSTERLHGPVVDKNGQFSNEVTWRCTVSVGVASKSPEANGAIHPLLSSADHALYEAKRLGRNQVRAS
jgi:diguanylate cyclase (GGDEF)-like protein